MQFSRLVSIAPMMECTDKHDRFFLRLIAPHVYLYSEMITTKALIHGDCHRLLAFNAEEHPLALQLGGSDPKELAYCARLGEAFGYDEINLNAGCPSARVASGRFGACLMREPALVAECISAMRNAVTIPVTVKCRIGVDEQDSYEQLVHFIETIAEAGCQIVIIHARKALLNGFSPKKNRHIPPLRYDIVLRLKQTFPQLTIIINGGIKTIQDIQSLLNGVDGVMIGREAYGNPYFLAEIEQTFFSAEQDLLTRHQVIEKMILYMENELSKRTRLSSMARHILGLFQGQPGARMWRRYLSENMHHIGANTNLINEALHYV